MLNRIIISILTLCVFLLSPPASAEDIAALSIHNKVQLQVVQTILDHAITKSGDRFVVSLDKNQSNLLRQSGIDFDVLLGDVNISDYSIIYPSGKPEKDLFDVSKLGTAIDIGAGIYIGSISSTMATSLSEQSGLKVVPLSESKIRFYYLPKSYANLLAGIEDFPYDTLADRVSQDSIYAYNTRLEDFYTRYIWTDSIDAARDWIVQKFLDWGYTDVTTPSFYWGGGWHYNVMAVKPGYAEPDKVIVIGGHYDSIVYGQPQPATEYAPGSDDNGSGTTVTLELARILADIPLRKTIIFMPFSAEEVGLIGSSAAASEFASNGTKLEVMYNFDMVGFTTDSYWDIDLMSGTQNGYVNVSIDAGNRVTSLIPVQVGLSGSSDHWPFHEQGFNICYAEESDFNTQGWHTNLDLTSRMNFPYLTEVVKMSAAALGIVANSAYPTDIESIVDMGDGQSLSINWADCNVEYTYQMMYGSSSGIYTDTIDIPQGECSYIVNGLTEGTRYYFSVTGSVEGGYPAIYATESSGRPLTVPLPPTNANANPEYNSIILTWSENQEADFAYYRIYRDDGSGYVLYQDNLTQAQFTDNAVSGETEYHYKITAVDNDLNESNFSNETSSIPATFDQGILIADEIAIGAPMPDQAGQELYFDTLFDNVQHALVDINSSNTLSKPLSGQYSAIFWIDDDLNNKLIAYSNNTLDWYSGYSNNMMIAGFRTLSYWEPSPIPIDHILYREFGLSSYYEHDPFDFAGATGENGFPSVSVDLSNPLGYLPYIETLSLHGDAKVIYRYHSATADPAVEGAPVGLMYETVHGKRIILGFPLYFLTRESAEQLIAAAVLQFGEGNYLAGDVNNDNSCDIADAVLLVNYMFLGGPPPLQMNAADVDGSCEIDIADLVYLVVYFFSGGPQPLPGCVH